MSRVGVLVMAHGTPRQPEDLEAFYTRIRGGRPPSADQLAELADRYRAIGGLSPLAQRTAAQVAGVERLLEERAAGRFRVRFGAKHAEPLIEEAVAGLTDEGVAGLVALVLTPQESSLGSGQYLARARRAAGGVPFTAVAPWYGRPGLIELLAERLEEVLEIPGAEPARVRVLFSAHSLPERILAQGDPYPDQVGATAAGVASAARLEERGLRWEVAWQSAGRTAEPWIGPDLRTVLHRVAAEGARRVVVCPVGFVADHLEILFDLDVEAAAVAGEVGLEFARTASLNDDPPFVNLLGDLILEAAAGLAGERTR